ncbi:hypothetical protein [sulfur-oxidizing endosymbiont of Gigantopelta aegis]|uniref:hypothetical protein n=1 Tax=sulfur-oxidizing endosymbiont of Gigantopelta aegis TaxID=2794934 RepID=UPI0018DBCDBB|nr:hypothetical protein [sulfur-oxidizing endosymbiont of Gigantopelta aegis]
MNNARWLSAYEQLKNRTDDTPFVKELREKEKKLAYLESISIDPETVRVAHLDQAAFPRIRR